MTLRRIKNIDELTELLDHINNEIFITINIECNIYDWTYDEL